MPTYTIKSGNGIEDGLHTGKIIVCEEVEREGTNKQGKKEKWKYIDIIIKVNDTNGEVKYSCPAPKETLNPMSKLGKLLTLFVQLEDGAPIDPFQVLIGKELVFQTTTNENGFSEILDRSIKKKV